MRNRLHASFEEGRDDDLSLRPEEFAETSSYESLSCATRHLLNDRVQVDDDPAFGVQKTDYVLNILQDRFEIRTLLDHLTRSFGSYPATLLVRYWTFWLHSWKRLHSDQSEKKRIRKKGGGVFICIMSAGRCARPQAFTIVGISVMSAVMSMS